MKRVLIVDDNENMCCELSGLLTEVAGENVQIDTRTSGSDALLDVEVEEICPDIVFMDIELGRQNGIEVAEQMLKSAPTIQLVFVSGYDDYYLDVYKVGHVHFIRKPFERAKVKEVWDILMQRQQTEHDNVFTFKTGGQYRKVHCRDIMYFEMEARKVRIFTEDDEDSFYGTMGEILESVGDNFVQCHKSYVINLETVEEFFSDHVILKDGRQVPVSRTYRKTVKEKFMEQLI